MTTRPVLVIGDLICDHYVWGDVSRVSPEAPVQVLEWEREANRAGGAANVALNLSSLGYDVKLAGLVGRDEDGRWLRRELSRHGIDTTAIVISETRPTTRKLRIIARNQQLLRVDREDRDPIGKQDERLLFTAHSSGTSSDMRHYLFGLRQRCTDRVHSRSSATYSPSKRSRGSAC